MSYDNSKLACFALLALGLTICLMYQQNQINRMEERLELHKAYMVSLHDSLWANTKLRGVLDAQVKELQDRCDKLEEEDKKLLLRIKELRMWGRT